MLCTIIISYLELPCGSYTWKLHINIFLASISVITFSILLLWLVFKSPPCLLQQN